MSWGKRWSNTLLNLDMPEDELQRRRRQGLATARSGRVMELHVSPGRLSAKVQGGRATPFLVNVEVKQLSKEDWQTVIAQLAASVRYCARLLANQEPDGFADELQTNHAISLFPQVEDITFVAGHGKDELVPVVGIAVWEAMAQRLRNDPFALFHMRGRTKNRVLREISKARKIEGAHGGLVASELRIEGWNRPRGRMDNVPLPLPHLPRRTAPALNMLGDPEGWKGTLSAMDMFAPIIEAASEETFKMLTDQNQR